MRLRVAQNFSFYNRSPVLLPYRFVSAVFSGQLPFAANQCGLQNRRWGDCVLQCGRNEPAPHAGQSRVLTQNPCQFAHDCREQKVESVFNFFGRHAGPLIAERNAHKARCCRKCYGKATAAGVWRRPLRRMFSIALLRASALIGRTNLDGNSSSSTTETFFFCASNAVFQRPQL